MISVGAIWYLEADAINKFLGAINKAIAGIGKEPIWITVSKCGGYWYGADMNTSLPRENEEMVKAMYIQETDYNGWNPLRMALLDGRLGVPTFGVNPHAKPAVTKSVTCTCSIRALLIGGCPSTRGIACPSL